MKTILLLSAALLAVQTGTAAAATVVEAGDAGATRASAQAAGGTEVTRFQGALGAGDVDTFGLSFTDDLDMTLSNLTPGGPGLGAASLALLDGTGATVWSCASCWPDRADGSVVMSENLMAGDYYVQVADIGGSGFGAYAFDIESETVIWTIADPLGPSASVPLPPGVLLLGSAMIGAGAVLRRRRASARG